MYNLDKLMYDIVGNTEFKEKVFSLEPFSIDTSHSVPIQEFSAHEATRFRASVNFNIEYVSDSPESFKSDKEDAAKRLLRHTLSPCFNLVDELENYICNGQIKEAKQLIKEFKGYFK